MKQFPLAVLGAFGVLLFWRAAAQADFTIMPLGDSTTWGGAPSPPYVIVPGGYRTRLYTDLQNAGYSFTFVGTSTDNPSPVWRLRTRPGSPPRERPRCWRTAA
jgi:hypothetical protein